MKRAGIVRLHEFLAERADIGEKGVVDRCLLRDQIGDRWADRGPSLPVQCPATSAEELIFAELTEVWLAGKWSDEPLRGLDRLFPYTLLKSFLSSHRGLAETVAARRRKAAATGTERDASFTQTTGEP